ncbi:MAG: hypothetical protein IJ131_03865 [Eggerthellaceae bacterium]|nr:hypothetical protein [Eggerthellaceae bacterium]
MDSVTLYEILYALVAMDGREAALFGNYGPYAREAFRRSLAGESFPELWFEIPLAGDPWLDLHALVSYEDVAGTQASFSGQEGVYANAIEWFAAQSPHAVRQLALSYDTSAQDVDHPAVQLLVNSDDIAAPIGFLQAVGQLDATEPYRTFVESMPHPWYACYVGVFPRREEADGQDWVRVECIVGDQLQHAYANSAEGLIEHLTRVGLQGICQDAVEGIRAFARTPFPLELQFNVGKDGKALPVVSASVRFQPKDWMDGQRREHIDHLFRWIQKQGMADNRWELLADTLFAKSVTRGGKSAVLSCFPAFVKLRWRKGEPPCAKAYLMGMAPTTNKDDE